MSQFFSKNYWSIGFQSKFYDRLSPESYFDSMRRVIANLPPEKSLSLLDAGCGSGLVLQFLAPRIKQGMHYTGLDMLKPGVVQTLLRAQKLNIAERVSCFQSDLITPFPVTGQKYDVIVAHFSLYTLDSIEHRQMALKNLKAVLKDQGHLIIVNPSVNYNAVSIIDHSVQLLKESHGLLSSLIKKYMVYPFTKTIGLRFIQKQLRSGVWKAYTHEAFSQEFENAGFEVQHIEEVYAGSALLGIGRNRP